MIEAIVVFMQTKKIGIKRLLNVNELRDTIVIAAGIAPNANVCQVSSAGFSQACLIVGSAAIRLMPNEDDIATVGELKMSQNIRPATAPAWHSPSNTDNLALPYFRPAATTARVAIEAPIINKAVRDSCAVKAAAMAILFNKPQVNHDTTFGRVLPLKTSIIYGVVENIAITAAIMAKASFINLGLYYTDANSVQIIMYTFLGFLSSSFVVVG
jgi:hypothetical protein